MIYLWVDYCRIVSRLLRGGCCIGIEDTGGEVSQSVSGGMYDLEQSSRKSEIDRQTKE